MITHKNYLLFTTLINETEKLHHPILLQKYSRETFWTSFPVNLIYKYFFAEPSLSTKYEQLHFIMNFFPVLSGLNNKLEDSKDFERDI